MNSLID